MGYYGILMRRRSAVAAGTIYLFTLRYALLEYVNSLTVKVDFTGAGWVESNDVDQSNYPWVYPVGSEPTTNFEMMVTQTSGPAIAGIMNTWLNMGTTHSYSLTRTTPGTARSVMHVLIRRSSTGVIEGDANITLELFVEGLP